MINTFNFCNAIAWHMGTYSCFGPLQQQFPDKMASSSTIRTRRFLIQSCTPRKIYLQDSLLGSVDINCHERSVKICWCSFRLTPSVAIKPRLSPTAQQVTAEHSNVLSILASQYPLVSCEWFVPNSPLGSSFCLQWLEEQELQAHKPAAATQNS